jgi:hypothetical protein
MNSSSRRRRQALAPTEAQFLVELANLRREAEAIGRFRRRFDPFIPEPGQPFVAVATEPHRDRKNGNPDAAAAGTVPSDAVQRAALALRTGKYRKAASAPEGQSRTLSEEPRPSGIRPTPDEPQARVPYQPAASDTDTPSRGILGALPKPIDSAEQETAWVWTLHEHLCHVWDQPDPRTREWGVFLLLLLVRGEAGSRHLTVLGFPGPLPPPTPFEKALLWFVDVRDRARHCPNPDCPAPYYFATRRSQKYCSDRCALPAQREFKRRWWAEHGAERRQRNTRTKKAR